MLLEKDFFKKSLEAELAKCTRSAKCSKTLLESLNMQTTLPDGRAEIEQRSSSDLETNSNLKAIQQPSCNHHAAAIYLAI